MRYEAHRAQIISLPNVDLTGKLIHLKQLQLLLLCSDLVIGPYISFSRFTGTNVPPGAAS